MARRKGMRGKGLTVTARGQWGIFTAFLPEAASQSAVQVWVRATMAATSARFHASRLPSALPHPHRFPLPASHHPRLSTCHSLAYSPRAHDLNATYRFRFLQASSSHDAFLKTTSSSFIPIPLTSDFPACCWLSSSIIPLSNATASCSCSTTNTTLALFSAFSSYTCQLIIHSGSDSKSAF